MKPFRLRRGGYIATITQTEAALLANLIDQLHTLLTGRRDETGSDPLADLTGVTVGPSTPPQDPALARLFPDFHQEDPEYSAAMRMLREPEVLAAKDDAASVLRDTLPLAGGTVRLDQSEARSWLMALNDIRLVLGVRLSISEDEPVPAAVRVSPNGAEHAMFLTYQWLTMIQESLTDAMVENVI